jgi:TolB protein
MKEKCKMKSVKLKVISYKLRVFLLFSCVSFFTLHYSLLTCDAKVYIDISSPAFKKLPIAVQDFAGPSGEKISAIIRNDLDFTGLFATIDKAAYLESPSQPFNPKNWTPLGAEAVVKGFTREAKEIIVTMSLYDVAGGKEILRKEYRAEKGLIRPLSHTIANDIHYALTGETGVFRSRITFIGEEKGERALYLMDWDGNWMNKTGVKGKVLMSPRWSKDGTKVVYSDERNRQWGIYLVDFSNMSERKVYSSKGTNIAGDFLRGGSEVIISSSKDGTPDLYVLNLKNSNTVKLTSSFGIEVSPAVSPDGRSIAFVSDKGGSPQIYTMRADGADVKRISFEGSYNTSPAWSPKGDKIVFSGRRGANQLFIVNPDGSGLIQLTSQGNNEDPSFSPDGRYISFVSDRDGVKGVYIMRASGESQQRITPRTMKAYGPRWSPD